MISTEERKVLVFFLSAYDELVELCHDTTPSDYKINQISRILRQFIFDKNQIVAIVSKIALPKIGQPIFNCCPYQPILVPHLEFGGIYDGFYPSKDSANVKTLRINQLGSVILIEYKGKPYNLKQLVKYIANKEGGVHFDQKNLDIDEEALQEIQNYFGVGGRAALTRTLVAIGNVIIDGIVEIAESTRSILASLHKQS